MKKIMHIFTGLILICMPAALAGCTDAPAAIEGAEALGLTDVKPGGHAFFGCGRDDDTATEFIATNANGQLVRGVACSNWSPFGKATTIRIVGIIR